MSTYNNLSYRSSQAPGTFCVPYRARETTHAVLSVPPGDDGSDQGEDGDDLGKARAPAAAGDGRRRGFGAFGLVAPVRGIEVRAVVQAGQSAQALDLIFDGA